MPSVGYKVSDFQQLSEQIEIYDLLVDACFKGDSARVTRIFDINRFNHAGQTALCIIINNKTKVVKILLDQPDLLSILGKNEIHCCCMESISMLSKDKRCTPEIVYMKNKRSKKHKSKYDIILKHLEEKNKELSEALTQNEVAEQNRGKHSKSNRVKQCWYCLATPTPCHKLYHCGGCRVAWYCRGECQEKDWARHRDWCEWRRNKRQRKLEKTTLQSNSSVD